jgi:hypothetical protein
MKRISFMLVGAIVCATAAPSFAAWDRIGSLDVTAGKTAQFSMQDFKGNVIGLTARQSEVMCDRVTATFANGDIRPIFRGKLPKGVSVRVDLPPGAVDRVDFDCKPINGKMATIDLAADSGVENSAPQGHG